MRTEQIVKLQKEVTRLKNENKHYRIEKEASLLANKLINSYVEELEEDNKNLQVLSSINRKEHMRIHEQNKRYYEALENIMYASATIYSHEMISAINKTALKALEGDSND